MGLFRQKTLDRETTLASRPLMLEGVEWSEEEDEELVISLPRRKTAWVGCRIAGISAVARAADGCGQVKDVVRLANELVHHGSVCDAATDKREVVTYG